MNYRTTCPQCASVFRLGMDQLEAAQGWVQCSVCGAAFDARLNLLMEDGSPLPPAEPEPTEAAPLAEAASPPRHEIYPTEPEALDIEPEAAEEGSPVAETPEAASSIEDVTAAAPPSGIAQRDKWQDLPSIILIDPDTPILDEELGPLPQTPPVSSYPPAPATGVPTAPVARIEYATAMPGTARVPTAPKRVNTWVWATASTLLLLVLLAQMAYFMRDTLVSRLPETRPALEQACAVLGCTLSLPKNLALLQIVGSDLQTESKGRLRLTLTLGNRANHVQAWPVLLLTLTDQRNRPLARRSFAPSEYLSDSQRIAAGIPPRSEQLLNLPLTVRDLAPMGFDLQLTY